MEEREEASRDLSMSGVSILDSGKHHSNIHKSHVHLLVGKNSNTIQSPNWSFDIFLYKTIKPIKTVIVWIFLYFVSWHVYSSYLDICSNNIIMHFFESLDTKRGFLLDFLSSQIAFLSLFSMPVLITLKIKLQLLLQQKLNKSMELPSHMNDAKKTGLDK